MLGNLQQELDFHDLEREDDPNAIAWSPQQIAGWLERTFGNDDSRRVSHETIYSSLFIQARGVLKKELMAHLRRGRLLRYGRGHRSKVGKGCGAIAEAVSIRERPTEVEDRAVPGHWEGDLLCGPPGTQIATLVERQYFPKGTDLSGYSQAHLDRVDLQLNQRPRETLGFHTPANKRHARVASIGHPRI